MVLSISEIRASVHRLIHGFTSQFVSPLGVDHSAVALLSDGDFLNFKLVVAVVKILVVNLS